MVAKTSRDAKIRIYVLTLCQRIANLKGLLVYGVMVAVNFFVGLVIGPCLLFDVTNVVTLTASVLVIAAAAITSHHDHI